MVTDLNKCMKTFNCKQKNSSGSLKNIINKISLQIMYLKYMYKKDFAFNNLQYKPQLN